MQEKLFEETTVQLTLPGGTIYPLPSRPSYSDSRIDPATGMIEVSATFANPELALLPGLKVQVLSQIEGDMHMLSAVPREAARMDEAGLHVLVLQPSGLFERRPITLLRVEPTRFLVAGVFADEEVATSEGAMALRDAVVVPNADRTN